jgi:hypothetical protein
MEESQCIYCESVYKVSDSNSTIPTACCSKKCEDAYGKAIENLEFV